MSYAEAWDMQREMHGRVVAGDAPDTVMFCEHPSVYTAGRRTMPAERPTDGTPVVDVDRGGKITWHGPGQLVGYPIVHLPAGVFVVDYVRRLETALIATCDRLGVPAGRVSGRTGVWTADGSRKLAAIGIRVARGVAMHGFALNCNCALTPFERIIPCGITDAGVGSLSGELGKNVSVDDVVDVVGEQLRAVFEERRVSAA
jgi:lipoyl(octanoyl) transferase